jgi:hypothetical protein
MSPYFSYVRVIFRLLISKVSLFRVTLVIWRKKKLAFDGSYISAALIFYRVLNLWRELMESWFKFGDNLNKKLQYNQGLPLVSFSICGKALFWVFILLPTWVSFDIPSFDIMENLLFIFCSYSSLRCPYIRTTYSFSKSNFYYKNE